MRLVLSLVLVVLVAPVAWADEGSRDVPAQPEIVQPAVSQQSAEPAPRLDPVAVPERTVEKREAAATTAMQDMPRRGSFWWLVGVIVVAGVILALLLD